MAMALRRGWRLGAVDFLERPSEKLGRRGQRHESASQRHETDTARAKRPGIGAPATCRTCWAKQGETGYLTSRSR